VKIRVEVKPNSKVPGIEAVENHLVVRVKEPPTEGRANAAVVRAVADYYRVAPSDVRVVSGYTSRRKTLEIADV